MTTRPFGFVALGALVVAALVALWTLIFSQFDETAGKILGTTAAIAGHSLLIMGAATGREDGATRSRRALALGAIAVTLAAFVALMVLVWGTWAHEDSLARTYGSLEVASLAMVIAVLLGRITSPARVVNLRIATVVLVMVFASAADWILFIEQVRGDDGARLLGVLGVLAALGVLVTPIAAWQARHSLRAATDAAVHRDPVTCPQCGHAFMPAG